MKISIYTVCLVALLTQWTVAQTPLERYSSWSTWTPSQKAFLIFNQDKYAPGDTAYFKAYVFSNQLLLTSSEVLTLSVVDQRGRQTAKVNFRVNRGATQNRIHLPDSLSPGLYRFVAFSEWMIGNPSSPAFSTELPIVNRDSIATNVNADLQATFFTEGGRFIAGLTNKVVVRTNAQDEIVDGIVIDDAGMTVVTVKLRAGMGAIFLNPAIGRTYKLRINDREFALPKVENDGLSILFNKSKNRSPVRLVITAPDGSPLRKQNLQLLLTLNGRVYLTQALTLDEQPFYQLSIPVTELPAGIARLAIFNGGTSPIGERFFFVEQPKPVKAAITTVQSAVRVRDKISLEVTLSDENGPVEGEFALSAVNSKLFAPANSSDFADELILSSRLAHKVDRSRPDWDELLDQAMITMRTDPAEWTEVFSGRNVVRPTGGHFHMEFSATSNGEPVPDSTIMMVFLQKDATGYAARVMGGKFDFSPLGDFKGIDELFCVGRYAGKDLDNLEVTYVEPAIDLGAASPFRTVGGTDPYAEFALRARAIRNSYSFFSESGEAAVIAKDPNQELEDELDGADVSVELSKYIAFPNMDEVIREVIPALFHFKKGGKSTVRVDLIKTDAPPKSDPLYIIDGIMTLDTDYFIALDPLNVQTIKVVRDAEKLAQWGPVGRAGVVFVRTKVPAPAAVRAGGTFVRVQGFSWPLKTMPEAAVAPVDRPDFRSTLHWAPLVKTDKNGKAVVTFYASDDTGPVAIRLAGVTTSGVPFSASATLNVDFTEK
jgi:hypothetical protein